ncbi:hypothetical protein U4E84_08300 [Halorubrum sp. AD140]|uniref:hypothetical protein n=1 Tax=Halorubrum sp. AD140 TaxID=3050073 RepID=UPI002ACC4481|nr:hypothetical protein [Halorubrum sp. AD140]MDZ5811348.1 hypothetical protein [Halorubrum sp. AD140]
MTLGRDGGRRPGGLSRRQLLTGIGGIGAVGMASGLGTGAYLSDRAAFDGNALGAGGVELTMDGTVTSGAVELGVSGIEPGDAGTERFEVGVRTNPVRVWLAADCPGPDGSLADALEVDVRVDSDPISGGQGVLADVQRALAGGVRIDVGCLDPDGALDVTIDWRLPDDATDSLEETAAALAFRLYAEQCRHVSEADAEGSNPFADRVCDEPEDDCPACVEFGKADDVEAALTVGDLLPLVELPDGTGPHSIEITVVETKDDGEAIGAAFSLIDAAGDPGPDLCAVEVKGGPDTVRHEIAPVGPDTGEVVFAPVNDSNDKRYGISNIVVFVCDGVGGDGDDDGGDGDDDGGEEAI